MNIKLEKRRGLIINTLIILLSMVLIILLYAPIIEYMNKYIPPTNLTETVYETKIISAYLVCNKEANPIALISTIFLGLNIFLSLILVTITKFKEKDYLKLTNYSLGIINIVLFSSTLIYSFVTVNSYLL